MSEVLIKFDTAVTADDGRAFKPRACGRLRDDGLYEGWIEFVPVLADAEVEPIRTSGETVQPNRADLLYWAAGLTQTYLDGALRLLDLLIGRRLRQADVARNLVVRCVDRGESP